MPLGISSRMHVHTCVLLVLAACLRIFHLRAFQSSTEHTVYVQMFLCFFFVHYYFLGSIAQQIDRVIVVKQISNDTLALSHIFDKSCLVGCCFSCGPWIVDGFSSIHKNITSCWQSKVINSLGIEHDFYRLHATHWLQTLLTIKFIDFCL